MLINKILTSSLWSNMLQHMLHNHQGQFNHSLMDDSMTRIKSDCITGSFSPSLSWSQGRASQARVEKLQESFRPTLEGYCFGYRGFTFLRPFSLFVHFWTLHSQSRIRSSSCVSHCIYAGVISDAIECRALFSF